MEGTQSDKLLIDIRTDSQNNTPLEEPSARQTPVVTRKTLTHSDIKLPARYIYKIFYNTKA